MNPFRVLFWIGLGFVFQYSYDFFGIWPAVFVSLVVLVLFYGFLAKKFPNKKKKEDKPKIGFRFL